MVGVIFSDIGFHFLVVIKPAPGVETVANRVCLIFCCLLFMSFFLFVFSACQQLARFLFPRLDAEVMMGKPVGLSGTRGTGQIHCGYFYRKV